MKVLKGLALGILSFFLFLSLSVFGIAFTLNSTILNADFVVSEVDNIPVSSLIRELAEEQISKQLPEEAQFLKEAIYNVVSAQEPWIKEQAEAAIYSAYDFLLGKSESLSLTISLETLKESLRESLLQSFLQSLPAELSGASQAQIEQYFNSFYQEFSTQIPSSFEVDESYIPSEVMAQIIQVRQGISYFRIGYNALIGFMVLLVLGIILISRQVRGATRELGTTFLTYGALEYAGAFVALNFIPLQGLLQGIPSSLHVWLVGIFDDILAPLQVFSLGCLIGGAVLLIVSFVYRPRVAEEE